MPTPTKSFYRFVELLVDIVSNWVCLSLFLLSEKKTNNNIYIYIQFNQSSTSPSSIRNCIRSFHVDDEEQDENEDEESSSSSVVIIWGTLSVT